MAKGVANRRYTPEFKKPVVETMQKKRMYYTAWGCSDTDL